MYVIVANGISGLVHSKNTLDVLASLYPYPKFRKVSSEEEAFRFLQRYRRDYYKPVYTNYGDCDVLKHLTVDYVIDGNDLYISIDSSKMGLILIDKPDDNNVIVDSRPNMTKVKVKNVNLNNDLISDHCIAISIICNIIGEYADINIRVPDISVYLALTRYTGSYYSIVSAINTVKSRLGGVSFTIL